MNKPVLSVFPGIGLLDRAFEEEGFCVVRGPDRLWGGDVRTFHPPAGAFQGVIGGPPCQVHSRFSAFAKHRGHKLALDLIPEYVRVIEEGQPAWFLMENVRTAYAPVVKGYAVHSFVLQNRHLGEAQNRERLIAFGLRGTEAQDLRKHIRYALFDNPEWCSTILASGGMKPGTERKRGKRLGREYGYVSKSTYSFALKAQGLPEDFLHDAPFTMAGKFKVIGNGVPVPMGRALALAVREVLGSDKDVPTERT